MIKRIYTGQYDVLRRQIDKARKNFYITKYESMSTEEECDDAYAVWAQLRRDLKESVIFEDVPDPYSGKDLLASLIQDVTESKIRFSLWQHTDSGIYYLQVHGWSLYPYARSENVRRKTSQSGDREQEQSCYIKILEKDIPAGYCAKPLAQWPKPVYSLGPRLRREVLAALQASVQVQALNVEYFQND